MYTPALHRDASAGAIWRTDGRNAHALCMNASTYTVRAGFIPGGTLRRAEMEVAREEERGNCSEMRDGSTDAAVRSRGPT